MHRLAVAASIIAALSAPAAAAPKPAGKAARVATAEQAAKAPVSRSSACWARFNALCGVMQRCAVAAEDMGARCDAIDPGCDDLAGDATYGRSEVDRCISDLRALSCARRADPNDARAMDFEAKVDSCRTLLAADAAADRASRSRARTATAAR